MNENPFVLIDRLAETHSLSVSEYQTLVLSETETLRTYAAQKADKIRRDIYGDSIYIRGLIEVSNVCRNDCYYCGIRASNRACDRYLLTDDQILSCCAEGYALGFRTFVMQGGEGGLPVARVCSIVTVIKPAIRTAPSPSPWGNTRPAITNACTTQGPTATCSGTKLPIKPTTNSCILKRCPLTTVCDAYMT